MKYFVVTLLALAGNVKISDADCQQLVTINRDFGTICNNVNPDKSITLPHPENKQKFVECFKKVHRRILNSEFFSTCFFDTCYDIIQNLCEDPAYKPACVDPAEICAEGDTLVLYAPKNKPFFSKFFADCTKGPKNFEVGICYSDDEDETCVFHPKEKRCVRVVSKSNNEMLYL